jgi:hypothetical protein
MNPGSPRCRLLRERETQLSTEEAASRAARENLERQMTRRPRLNFNKLDELPAALKEVHLCFY